MSTDPSKNEEEDQVVAHGKILLASDKLRALEWKGRGRTSLVSEEVKSTEKALSTLRQSLLIADQRSKRLDLQPTITEDQFAARSPRTYPRTEAPAIADLGRAELDAEEKPRTYLSREAQSKISRICSARNPGPVQDEGPTNVLDALIHDLRSARTPRREDPDVVPYPELVRISAVERRALAPHVAEIYDQVVRPHKPFLEQ